MLDGVFTYENEMYTFTLDKGVLSLGGQYVGDKLVVVPIIGEVSMGQLEEELMEAATKYEEAR